MRDDITLTDAWGWLEVHKVNPCDITAMQLKSIMDVINRQGAPILIWNDYLCGCVMIQFDNITVGIEKDGYAHS